VPQRTAWEIARESDLVEAVVALDILLHYRYFRAASMAGWVAARPRSRAVRALSLADGRAESPQETRTRLRIRFADFPASTPQFDVWHGHYFVARVDLAWPEAKVAVEYDGEWHANARQLAQDRARLNRLVHAGWVVLHLTKRELADDALFGSFAVQLRAALAR
jgi:very-short-patch-repair endonuclease